MQRSENANADVDTDTDTNSTISKPDKMSRLLYKSLQQLVEKTDKLVETNFVAAQRETEERAKGRVQQRVLYLETSIDMLQEKKRTISEKLEHTKKQDHVQSTDGPTGRCQQSVAQERGGVVPTSRGRHSSCLIDYHNPPASQPVTQLVQEC